MTIFPPTGVIYLRIPLFDDPILSFPLLGFWPALPCLFFEAPGFNLMPLNENCDLSAVSLLPKVYVYIPDFKAFLYLI